MSLRSKALTLVEVLLRVPPLFVVDEFLKISLGIPVTIVEDVEVSNVSNSTIDDNEELPPIDAKLHLKAIITLFYIGVKFSICFLGCFSAICVFLLYTKHLIIVYLFLISLGIVFLSYWINASATKEFLDLTQTSSSSHSATSILENILDLNLKSLLDVEGPGIVILQNLAIQFLLSILFRNVHLGPQHPRLQKLLPLSFMAPSFLAMLPVSAKVLHNSPILSSLLPLVLVQHVIWASSYDILKIIYSGYQHGRLFVNRNGLSALIETEWLRLNVLCVLRVFWTMRVTESAIVLLVNNQEDNDEGLKASARLGVQWFASMAKSLVITGSETITAMLGMTSAISIFCHYIGSFFQWILLNPEEDDSIGTVSAILFYVLALQTGLTSLHPEKRFIILGRNVCLLITAVLHFLHDMVNPILMSVSASQNPRTHRHSRALGVCAFLVIFSSLFLVYLWSHHSVSTWLLAVSIFSVEVIIKVGISLLIYSLFILDAYRSTFWEKLDDSVYYIRAFGHSIEFCFGVFLFFMGSWNLMFESGSAMRAVMMCIHAYFNIWNKGKSGWSVLKKRRTAVNKINSLEEATEDQLKVEDVCAICYQEMRSAKITICNHFFHGVCLRKWLYVQDKCPLCHEILYKTDELDPDEESDEEDADDEDDVF